MAKKKRQTGQASIAVNDYDGLLAEVVSLLEDARHTSARTVNAIMTATYWRIGRRIVEVEQAGKGRAEYGQQLLEHLASDLTKRFGRGFSQANLKYMRQFYHCWPIRQTLSDELEASQNRQTASDESRARQLVRQADVQELAVQFPLPWSHYVRLMSVEDEKARQFYEAEALRGGWSVRQLKRQIDSQFYERTLLSRNKAAMLRKGAKPQPGDVVAAEEEIKDPFVLEFLGNSPLYER